MPTPFEWDSVLEVLGIIQQPSAIGSLHVAYKNMWRVCRDWIEPFPELVQNTHRIVENVSGNVGKYLSVIQFCVNINAH